MNGLSPMNGPSEEEQKRYQAECDLRTLTEAGRIRKDKDRTEAVRKIAQEQTTAVKEKK